jgi:hypothetical protein
MAPIIIFDLDGTIDGDCLGGNIISGYKIKTNEKKTIIFEEEIEQKDKILRQRYQLMKILDKIEKSKGNVKKMYPVVFILTARRLSDFKERYSSNLNVNESLFIQKLFEYNLPKDIVDKINTINRKYNNEVWFHYNETNETPEIKVDELIEYNSKNNLNLLNLFNDIINDKELTNTVKEAMIKIIDGILNSNIYGKNFDLWTFKAGIYKMMKIQDIINNIKRPSPDIINSKKLFPSFLSKTKTIEKDIYFFDDSIYNKLAWIWYYKNINSKFKNINFIGGKDKCVFDDNICKRYSEIC